MLESIAIDNFRCIATAALEFDARATGIIGANAAGKTSLLEAIFYLAHGRSFRSAVRAELIRNQASSARVIATLRRSEEGRTIVAGAEFDEVTSQVRLEAQPAALWKVAQVLPTQIIDPSVHRILEEGSVRRRRLMDWGVFHVKPPFIAQWRRYQRALAQRNAALRSGADQASIEPWTEALIATSEDVHISRMTYLDSLIPIFQRISGELLGSPAELKYRSGWNSELTLPEALRQSGSREWRLKTTLVGPHRADLDIRWGNALARKRVSRGQQKLLAAALILAQIVLRAETQLKPVCLLLDDPAAELDVDNLGKLLNVVAQIPAQLILSSLERTHFKEIPLGKEFHVEQGKFRQML